MISAQNDIEDWYFDKDVNHTLRIMGKCERQIIEWTEGTVEWEGLLKTIRNKLQLFKGRK